MKPKRGVRNEKMIDRSAEDVVQRLDDSSDIRLNEWLTNVVVVIGIMV